MMQRRRFLESSLMAGVTLASAAPAGGVEAPGAKKAGPRGKPLVYELRTYHLRIGAQPKIVNDFLGEVLIPALNKLGVKPVGAFTTMFGPTVPAVTLLVPYESLAAYGTFQDRLAADLAKNVTPAAKAYAEAPGTAPAYVRMESQLLQAFDSFPGIEVPAGTAKKEPRIFELRTYESPGEAGSRKKMEMFTPKMGELEIFRRVGMTPVFFGRSLVGPRQPNFTYMLTFPDLAARDKAWTTFRADPEWAKLKTTPGFADAEIMSNIQDLVLAPTAYSQI